MRPATVNEWVEQIDEWAHLKGWRGEDDTATAIERLALIHSEVSEILEHLREGDVPEDWWITEFGKPDGPAIELADVVIRCFDYAARYNIDLQDMLEYKMRYNESRPYRHGKVI